MDVILNFWTEFYHSMVNSPVTDAMIFSTFFNLCAVVLFSDCLRRVKLTGAVNFVVSLLLFASFEVVTYLIARG